jgi:glyoxylase-like metal-dependent hydrolase (beta-lactamase superfamily II)
MKTIQVGDIRCTVLPDGLDGLPIPFVFANADPDELQPLIADDLDEEGNVLLSHDALLLEVGDRTILADAGHGVPGGLLPDALASAGIDASTVDTVLISHCHPDHIGGLIVERDGHSVPAFPNASHVISATEWDFWTSEEALVKMPEGLSGPARAVLPPLEVAGLVRRLDGETEVAPGIRVVPAPGHTPGHMAVSVGSGDGSILYVADAVLHISHLMHLDWFAAMETDPAQVASTRRTLLERAASEGSILTAYHMETRGRIRRDGDGYAFV